MLGELDFPDPLGCRGAHSVAKLSTNLRILTSFSLNASAVAPVRLGPDGCKESGSKRRSMSRTSSNTYRTAQFMDPIEQCNVMVIVKQSL